MQDSFASESRLPLLSGGLLNRRDLLRVGAISFGAGTLPRALAADPVSSPDSAGTAKSVIYLWMGGGVTHIDSFDPKPEAPEEVRGTLTAISTSLPGVQFCETMPQLARMADDLCIVRSFSHDSNDHLLSQVYTLSGRKVNRTQLFSEPNIGAIVSHLHGPRHGLPGYIAVPGFTRPGPPPHNLFVGGWLGQQYAPFCVGEMPENMDFTTGQVIENPSPLADENLYPSELSFPGEMTLGRLSRRADLRTSLAEAAMRLEQAAAPAALDGQYVDAMHLLTSPKVQSAFDLSSESDSTRDRYGRTKLGKRCLMARRLVEAGARFVMVDYGYDHDYGNLWDNHNAPSQNFPHVSELVKRGYHVAGMDRAFAGLIGDLKARGMLDNTLVVFLTEFGRTPKINANGGRDHWGQAGSIFFTGGGTRIGQVIGETDAQAAAPVTRPWSPADIAATIYQALGVSRDEMVYDHFNRPHRVLDHGEPIEGVLG